MGFPATSTIAALSTARVFSPDDIIAEFCRFVLVLAATMHLGTVQLRPQAYQCLGALFFGGGSRQP